MADTYIPKAAFPDSNRGIYKLEINDVEGRNVSGRQARVESLLMGRWLGRGCCTREVRNGLWDLAAQLEDP